MAGTPEGGKKAAETVEKRHPGFHKEIGAKGGKEHTPNVEASRKGGEHSHRGKSSKTEK